MESTTQAKEPKDLPSILTSVIVALLVVGIGAVGYVIYDNTFARATASDRVVESGDTVLLDYIGRFSDGRVFDTSILSVANDDVLYPKSLTFVHRANDSYGPFEMVAGNFGAGGTIKGFAMGVIGLRLNEEKVIVVPPEDGYAVNLSMIVTVPVLEQVPATEWLTSDEFSDLFGTDPVLMDTVPHYKWGWEVQVVSIVAGNVTIKHNPLIGEVVYPFGSPDDQYDPSGWACTVEGLDREANGGIGLVTVRHSVSSADVYNTKGIWTDGLSFVVSSFDAINQTFQIHKSNSDTGYNGEISGRTLYFEVKILNIK